MVAESGQRTAPPLGLRHFETFVVAKLNQLQAREPAACNRNLSLAHFWQVESLLKTECQLGRLSD